MFFHSLMALQQGGGGDPYVLPAVLRFDSAGRLEEFLAALEQVIARHEILRTSLAWEGRPEPVQVVWRHAPLPVTRIPADADGDAADAARVLAVAAGPVMDLG